MRMLSPSRTRICTEVRTCRSHRHGCTHRHAVVLGQLQLQEEHRRFGEAPTPLLPLPFTIARVMVRSVVSWRRHRHQETVCAPAQGGALPHDLRTHPVVVSVEVRKDPVAVTVPDPARVLGLEVVDAEPAAPHVHRDDTRSGCFS